MSVLVRALSRYLVALPPFAVAERQAALEALYAAHRDDHPRVLRTVMPPLPPKAPAEVMLLPVAVVPLPRPAYIRNRYGHRLNTCPVCARPKFADSRTCRDCWKRRALRVVA
jgi:hypothetical protein